MNLDVNICSVCGGKNFSDSEYIAPMKMCNDCFAKQQANMMHLMQNLQKKVEDLETKKVQEIKKEAKKRKQEQNIIAPKDTDPMHMYKYKAWDDEKLIWEVKQESNIDKTYTWEEARAYARKLNKEEYAGFDNWRLPTLDELKTLLTKEPNNGFYIKAPLSDNLSSIEYWTSTPYKDDSSGAGDVDFSDSGTIWGGKTNTVCVRCVRSRQ